MNDERFVALCLLAAKEHWCWDLGCSTCGHMNFRYAFAELARGKSPSDDDWRIHEHGDRQWANELPAIGPFSDADKERILEVCLDANLHDIQRHCPFPDWLGYLGLALFHLTMDSVIFRQLSHHWAHQLLSLVEPNSMAAVRLQHITQGESVLCWQDMELCEQGIFAHSMRY